jgi:hypothetical protein
VWNNSSASTAVLQEDVVDFHAKLLMFKPFEKVTKPLPPNTKKEVICRNIS